MIQISAVPASALPILSDQQVETGTEPTISAEFAAVLAAQTGSAAPAPATEAAGFVQPTAKPVAVTGKLGGKSLPLPAIAVAGLVAEMPASEVQATAAGDEGKAESQPETATPPVALVPASPFLQQVLAPFPQGAGALQSIADADLTQAGNRLAVRQAASPQSTTPLQQTPAQPLPPSSPEAQALAAPQTAATGGNQVQLQAAIPVTVEQTFSITGAAKETVEIRLPLVPAPAASDLQPANPVNGQQPVPANSVTLAASAATQLSGQHPATPLRARSARSGNDQGTVEQAVPQAESPMGLDDTSNVAPRQIHLAQALPAMPTDQNPSIAAPAPGAGAAPAARPEAPADFSTLVDRLVAAREAAQGSLATQAVHAAVAHAEFGQVSLRFEQQDGTLSVAMTSQDPDFARSVLAAAPASQQGADNTDNRGSAARQDTGQSMSQPQAQTQGQANGQGAQRSQPQQPQAASQPRQSSTAGSATGGEAPPSRQRGIFA